MNPNFLSKLGEFFRSNKEAIEAGEMTPEEVADAFKQARSHAGGKAKADARMSMSESFSRDGEWKLFMEQQFAEPPNTIQVLPKPGTYSHPRYGKFTMSAETIGKFVDNHNQHVYQEQVPIDAEHESKLSGAVGYYGEMRLIDEGRGGAEADVSWTDRGRQLIASDQFKYFSPEWFDEWTDPAGGKKIANVLVGGALTTRPYFKDKVMRPLVASEESYQAGEWAVDVDVDADGEHPTRTLTMSAMQFSEDDPDEDGKTTAEMTKKCAGCGKMSAEDAASCSGCGESFAKKANIDAGDVHVNAPIGGKDKSSKEKVKSDESSPGGRKMTEGIDDATKAFVEDQTKAFKEELESERGLRKAAETRLATLETEAQTRRFTDVIMGHDPAGDGSPPFAGKHEMHSKTLALIAKEQGEDSEQFKEYVAEQRAVAKQMREAGLFKEVGVSSHGEQADAHVATKKFDDAVAAWQAANPGKGKGEAIIAVSAEQPKLYSESIREKDRIAKMAPTTYGYEEEGQ